MIASGFTVPYQTIIGKMTVSVKSACACELFCLNLTVAGFLKPYNKSIYCLPPCKIRFRLI